MSEIIIQTRLDIPGLPENIISRERLNSFIRNNINKKLVLIEAPAGYGKTTLVLDFLNSYKAGYAWYRISEDTENFYTFISYIARALSDLNKRFGLNTGRIIDSSRQSLDFNKDQKEILESVLGTFINDFQNSFSAGTIIVIDDFHNLNGDWIGEALNFLFDNLPLNLHIIIITREKPPFNISKLLSKRSAVQVKTEDMMFNEQETASLLITLGSGDINIAKIVNKKLNGWITGIHLLLQVNNFRLNETNLKFEYIPGILYNYFASEIFDNLPDYVQDFLLGTALLEEFSPPLCDEILGTSRSRLIIDELYNKNIFIEQINEGADPVYKFQSLFNSFLLKKLNSIKSKDEINAVYYRVSQYFKESGDIVNHTGYLLKSGKYKDAIKLIAVNFDGLIKSGRYDLLWKWINIIPGNIKDNDPDINFYLGKIYYFYTGELEPTLEYINRAIKLQKKSHRRFSVLTLIEKTKLLVYLGRIDEALKNASKMLKIKEGKEETARIYYSVSTVYYSNTDYDKSLVMLAKAGDLAGKLKLEDLETSVNTLIGNIHLARGEFIKAAFFLELAVDKISNVYKRLVTFTNLAELHAYTGRYGKSKEYLEKAEEILKTFPSSYHELYLLVGEGFLRFECGDYEEAIKIHKKVNSIALKAKYNYYVYFGNVVITLCNYYLGREGLSAKHINIAESVTSKDAKYRIYEIMFLKILINKRDFSVRKAKGMEKNLLEILKYNRKNKFYYDIERILFHTAHFYMLWGNRDKSLKYISEAMALAGSNEYISFLEREYLYNREVFDFAVGNNIGKELIKKVHANITGINSTDISEPGNRLISKLAGDRMKNSAGKLWDIEMEAFGQPRFKVRGNYIPETDWVRKKSRIVLCWLVLNKNRKLNKDLLIDLFFSGLSIESAENVFHQVVHNIRNATGIAGSSQVKPELVIYGDKNLFLNPDYNYTSDIERFDEIYLKVFNTNNSLKHELIKEAKKIYSGVLFKGFDDEWCTELRNEYIGKMASLTEAGLKPE